MLSKRTPAQNALLRQIKGQESNAFESSVYHLGLGSELGSVFALRALWLAGGSAEESWQPWHNVCARIPLDGAF